MLSVMDNGQQMVLWVQVVDFVCMLVTTILLLREYHKISVACVLNAADSNAPPMDAAPLNAAYARKLSTAFWLEAVVVVVCSWVGPCVCCLDWTDSTLEHI